MQVQSVFQTAENALRELIKDSPQGSRIPSIRECARVLGIAPATVQKAFHKLENRRLIQTIGGKGTFRLPLAPPRPLPRTVVAQRSQSNLYEWLQTQIAQGILKRSEPLPSVKQLALQFRIAPATVIAAYRALCADGSAVKVGRRYWLSDFLQFRPGTQRMTVVLVLDEGLSAQHLFTQHPVCLAMQEMEYELTCCRAALHVIPFSELAKERSRWEQTAGAPLAVAFAYVLQPFYDRILPAVKRMRAQAFYSDTHFLIIGTRVGPMLDKVDYFADGSIPTAIMRTIARYCAGNMIRNVRVFHRFDRTKQEVLRDSIRLMPELMAATSGADIRYISTPISPPRPLESLVIEFGAGEPSYIAQILSKYRPIAISELASRMIFTGDFTKFYRALPQGCLCVFTDDKTAVEAIEFFRRSHLSIPRERAVVGLQNDPSWLHYGISSCVADWRTIGYFMAHVMLDDIPVERSRRGYVRVSARFLARRTTI